MHIEANVQKNIPTVVNLWKLSGNSRCIIDNKQAISNSMFPGSSIKFYISYLE
ncbi:MAG: hypothetical protein LJI21_01345 [Wolbachia endosymbiont of Menacanthus eurysternus]|nr:MAG: hypothetical protein LJI21_01345 [Wolbachia endosymbiont of Menacanthus eurysternus]